MIGVLHSQQLKKKQTNAEMLNLVVNISKEFIWINGFPFCVDDYVNKCNAAC